MFPASHGETSAAQSILQGFQHRESPEHLGPPAIELVAQGRGSALLLQGHQPFQQGVFIQGLSLLANRGQLHHGALFKQVADAAGLSQVAAMLAEGQTHFGGSAVAVVGEGLHQHRHATGAVALVAHRLEGFASATALP